MMKIKLDDIEKKNPYSVPSGYFESLSPEIQNKIMKKTPGFLSYSLILKWVLAPAMSILLAAGFWWNYSSQNQLKSADLLVGITEEDIMNYLEQSELTDMELLSLSNAPSKLLNESPNYLNGIDIEGGNLDELIENFDLNEDYL